jgi:Family of unknown function (DUF6515)
MKTKRYTLAVVFLVTAFLVFSTDILAQRGHYGNRGRGYGYGHSRNYSVRYYPQRNYYYNHPYVSLSFGGINYRYQRGYYYRPYGATFQFVIPPFGIRIATLPIGYRSFYIGPSPYYYYGGVYYRPYAGNQYEAVKPPLGAVVNELPPGAKVTVIDGKKYYELNGTYYEETITANSELQYTVVGTDGVLNTDNSSRSGDDNNTSHKNTGPAVGDRFDDLPADSKAVVINGEKLYLSPSGLYYKEVIEGNKVTYEVVGK